MKNRNKSRIVKNEMITERRYGMSRLEEFEMHQSDISEEGIRLSHLTSDKELATKINQTIVTLNKQISVAKRRGIIVELHTNFACMSDCSPLQAEIYKRSNL